MNSNLIKLEEEIAIRGAEIEAIDKKIDGILSEDTSDTDQVEEGKKLERIILQLEERLSTLSSQIRETQVLIDHVTTSGNDSQPNSKPSIFELMEKSSKLKQDRLKLISELVQAKSNLLELSDSDSIVMSTLRNQRELEAAAYTKTLNAVAEIENRSYALSQFFTQMVFDTTFTFKVVRLENGNFKVGNQDVVNFESYFDLFGSIDDNVTPISTGQTYAASEGHLAPHNLWQDVSIDQESGAISDCRSSLKDCTIRDLVTGIYWSWSNKVLPADAAGKYCETLRRFGTNGWTLPSTNDVMTASKIRSIQKNFSQLGWSDLLSERSFWTSSQAGPASDYAVRFYDSGIGLLGFDRNHHNRVMCIHY
ncbi:MAG: hypothetical protein NT027_19900 [Proteobacteria bacterium]|nr:hypothetical protein [Pseudomonadota bacterium]